MAGQPDSETKNGRTATMRFVLKSMLFIIHKAEHFHEKCS